MFQPTFAEMKGGAVSTRGTTLRIRYAGRGAAVRLATIAVVWAPLLAVYRPTSLPAQEACLTCHGDRQLLTTLVGDTAGAKRLFVHAEEFRESIHAVLGAACTMCHTGMGSFPHGAVPAVECGACHQAVREQLSHSVHGQPLAGNGVPASCADCHTNHHILGPSDPASSVYRLTQFEVCARCHSDPATMAAFGQEDTETVRSYVNSVHGRGLIEKGLTIAPVCTDCHGHAGTGAHEIEVVSSPTSPMHRTNVAQTCGRCHLGIKAQFDIGIHGAMLQAGNEDVPTCTDCHAEHAVQPVTSESSSVSPQHIAQTCTSCHDREDLNAKYNLPTARGRTFRGSFHGVALRSGQITVAHCESCHGAHEILPSSNPRSTIHPSNLQHTCGSCHPGIGAGVTQGKVHVASEREDVGVAAVGIKWFYFALIATTVVFSAVMIGLDQYRFRVVERRRSGRDG
jgi:hypothetical protein